MELESYFEFLPTSEIRIKGHRVYLEDVVREYCRGMNLEDLIERFDTLSVEEIRACLDYYQAHKEQIDENIRRWDEEQERAYQERQRDPRVIALKKRFEEARKRLEATPGSSFYKG